VSQPAFQCCNLKFSELKHKAVYGSDGKKIGKVIDFVFNFSNNKIALKSVVLGGSRIEELLESAHVKPDKDPVFELGCIDKITDQVYLKTACNSLHTTLDTGTIAAEDMKLSKLSKLRVMDSDGIKIGNVIDVWFDSANKIWLVLGGGFVEETLEKIGTRPNIDFLVPEDYIAGLTPKEIHLKWTKFQLRATCEKEYEKMKREVGSREQVGDSRQPQLRLTGAPPRGFV
jgi:sporulation protein YlmC with PRC-barrel domain